MRNLYRRFDCYYIRQIYGEDISKFCGLLRIYELYFHQTFQANDFLSFFNFLAAPTTPRQTGSLAAPGSIDDVVTRMKNIELIELGKHRIRPWYFSPYPQVKPHFFHAIPYCFYCQYLLFSMSGKKCLP